MLTFSSKTGELKREGVAIGRGYAGFGAGKLNPDMEAVHDVGPIPRGEYAIVLIQLHGVPVTYEGKAAPVFRLAPLAPTNTYGRSGFLIHGDSASNPGAASKGCVVVSREIRENILRYKDSVLFVGA